MKRLLLITTIAALTVGALAARTRTTQAHLTTAAIVLDVIEPAATGTGTDTIAGADIDQGSITLRGFNKKAGDSRESFLVTNNTDHRISAIRITLRYTTLDGSMIHERKVVVPITLNPGDTQVAVIKSFDTQRLFYYYAGPRPRKAATPFKVAYRLTGYDIPIGH